MTRDDQGSASGIEWFLRFAAAGAFVAAAIVTGRVVSGALPRSDVILAQMLAGGSVVAIALEQGIRKFHRQAPGGLRHAVAVASPGPALLALWLTVIGTSVTLLGGDWGPLIPLGNAMAIYLAALAAALAIDGRALRKAGDSRGSGNAAVLAAVVPLLLAIVLLGCTGMVTLPAWATGTTALSVTALIGLPFILGLSLLGGTELDVPAPAGSDPDPAPEPAATPDDERISASPAPPFSRGRDSGPHPRPIERAGESR